MQNDHIVILAARRTPIGSFQGSLKAMSAPQLGAAAIRAACRDSKVPLEDIDEVYMGCCLIAGLGQAPARQATLGAGLPDSTPATTISKMCGSGMKTVMLAHDLLRANSARVVVAGGMESMSNAPHLLPSARAGLRLGHGRTLDHLLFDGLQDAYDHELMGVHAETMAQEAGVGRSVQDGYALESVRRAQQAVREGLFNDEITPIYADAGADNKPPPIRANALPQDETPGACKPDKIPKLKPAFRPDGTVTAASSASISDGAAALVLSRASTAKQHHWPVMARIVGHCTHASAPGRFVMAPIGALLKLMARTGWSLDEVDVFEINEAFAVVPLLAMRELGLAHDKVNVRGGACALGHPIGATGARIIVTLLHTMRQRGLPKGVATLCIGGGEATAVAIELV